MRKLLILFAAGTFLTACSDDPDDPIKTECEESSECPTGQSCEDNMCVPDGTTPECTTASDCEEGEICEDNLCVSDNTPECTRTSDCEEGEICVDNFCEPDDDIILLECLIQEAPENGAVIQPEQPVTGDTADFTCDEGYLLFGEASLLCDSEGNWTGDAPVCGLCDFYSAESFALSQPSADDPDVNVPVGFDLDGHVTEEASDDDAHPDNGCNQVDAPGGIDNALGGVLGLLALFDLDVESSIADLIGNSLVVETRIQTIEGVQTLDIFVNGEIAAEALEVTENADGMLEASTDVFVLAIENLHLRDVVDEDDETIVTPVYVDIRLTLNNARFQVDPVAGSVLVGGVLIYGDDESGEEAFRPNVGNILQALEDAGVALSVDLPAVDGIFGMFADMALDGETCQDLSFGMLLPGSVGICE